MFWFSRRKSQRAIRPTKIEVLPKGTPWVMVKKKDYGEALFMLAGGIFLFLCFAGIVLLFARQEQAAGGIIAVLVIVTLGGTVIAVGVMAIWMIFATVRYLITGKPIDG
ncbi:MAG: hypothetical protein HYV55_00820 [Parcubacteria group bacterium]|nr:hypothetical protein [Parcubacteria group bacterium]